MSTTPPAVYTIYMYNTQVMFPRPDHPVHSLPSSSEFLLAYFLDSFLGTFSFNLLMFSHVLIYTLLNLVRVLF